MTISESAAYMWCIAFIVIGSHDLRKHFMRFFVIRAIYVDAISWCHFAYWRECMYEDTYFIDILSALTAETKIIRYRELVHFGSAFFYGALLLPLNIKIYLAMPSCLRSIASRRDDTTPKIHDPPSGAALRFVIIAQNNDNMSQSSYFYRSAPAAPPIAYAKQVPRQYLADNKVVMKYRHF